MLIGSTNYYFKLLLPLLALFVLSSCESELENEIELSLDIVYIQSQTDFDTYKKQEFPAGAHIYFAAGKVFNGQFAPTGSGTLDKPIKVTAYNSESGEIYFESMDDKPIINGHGKVNSPFYLYNAENWEINNLEITNTDGSDSNQGDLRGIHVEAEDMGTVENITIKNCYVHDVNGKVGEKNCGGIHVYVKGESVKTKFKNLRIENNKIANVGGVGIETNSSWPDFPQAEFYPWTGIIIKENKIMHTGRNGIIIRYCENPLVEYNTLGYNGLYSQGNSLMNFNTIGCIMQYNEIYGNTSTDKLEGDRGAFIAGFSCTGTIFQYNYTHDNHWSVGFGRKRDNSDVTIRYNIFQNEIVGAYVYAHPSDNDLTGVKVYNNIHYFGKGKGTKVFVNAGDKTRIPNNTEFKNNIFYFEDNAEWVFNPDNTCVLENNLFRNLSPKGTNTLQSENCFVEPGIGATDIDMHNPERLAGYKLIQNSPGLNAGVNISNNGQNDFWGNILYNNLPDIGVWEKWEQ